MDADNNCYKIEMAVPGARREDFIINVHDNVLFIAALPRNNNDSIEQHLVLPSNADSEFASAEYRQGLLNLYISKTNKLSKTTNQIVVY
jgi:HSP20 family protein